MKGANKAKNWQKSVQKPVDLPLSTSQIHKFQQELVKVGQQKKKGYLAAIQAHNSQLISKIKKLDRKVNTEMDSLSKKIVSPSKKRTSIPKVDQFETEELNNKFQEMQKLKKEIQIKKLGVSSLDFLMLVKKEQMIKLSALEKQVNQLKSEVSSLQKIKNKVTVQENIIKKELSRVGQFSMYEDQIQGLRRKVNQKNQQIKSKRSQFFSLYNKRGNKSLIVDPLPKEPSVQQGDNELTQLKKHYITMGKKIQSLKCKKAALLRSTPVPGQLLRQREKLKQKYQTLSKLSK